MERSFEHTELLEQKPSILLEVFRHDEKDQAESDHIAPLTNKGKLNAIQQGQSKKPQLNRGYVVTSPRERALHSALLQFFGPSLPQLAEADLASALKATQQHSHRIKTDERLNFHVESHPAFNDRFYAEYNKKDQNDTLNFQLNHSDNLILDLAQKAEPTDQNLAESIQRIKGYKRMVGDLAEVLLEYFDKLPEWQKDYQSHSQDFDHTALQIFIGTHSQNVECVLLRVMEMKEGVNHLKEFLAQLPHRKSFIGYSEGFSMNILADENGQSVAQLDYQNYHWLLSQADLSQLVADRTNFNQEVAQKLSETAV